MISDIGIEDLNGGWIPRLNRDAPLCQKLIEDIQDGLYCSEFMMNTCYHPKLLIAALQRATLLIELDDIPRMISRCIEYGLRESLEIILDHEDDLIVMHDRYVRGDFTDPIWTPIWTSQKRHNRIREHLSLDRELRLRRVGSVECYILARNKGYIDVGWEQAITRVQQRFRKYHNNGANRHSQQQQSQPYIATNPMTADSVGNTNHHQQMSPQSDQLVKSLDSSLHKTALSFEAPWVAYKQDYRYWGYRHTWHFLQWNRKLAYKVVRQILQGDWLGDCRYEAYLDFIEGPSHRPKTEIYFTK